MQHFRELGRGFNIVYTAAWYLQVDNLLPFYFILKTINFHLFPFLQTLAITNNMTK